MTQEILDDAQVGPTIEEMGGEAVPEGVGAHPLWQSRPSTQPIEPSAQTSNAERAAASVEEDLGRRRK